MPLQPLSLDLRRILDLDLYQYGLHRHRVPQSRQPSPPERPPLRMEAVKRAEKAIVMIETERGGGDLIMIEHLQENATEIESCLISPKFVFFVFVFVSFFFFGNLVLCVFFFFLGSMQI